MSTALVNALFAISLVVPPAAVVLGMLLLAWPTGRRNTAPLAFPGHAHGQ